MRSRGPTRTPCPSGDRARRGAGPNTRTHKRCCMNVPWNQTPAMCACRRRFVAVYSLARASAITNIASLTKSTTTVGYPDRPIRYVFSFICPVNRRLRFLGPLRIILLRLAINEHTNLTAISARAPQARRLEPAPEAHWEPQGTPDHSDRTRFIKRASRTRTRFNRSISIL